MTAAPNHNPHSAPHLRKAPARNLLRGCDRRFPAWLPGRLAVPGMPSEPSSTALKERNKFGQAPVQLHVYASALQHPLGRRALIRDGHRPVATSATTPAHSAPSPLRLPLLVTPFQALRRVAEHAALAKQAEAAGAPVLAHLHRGVAARQLRCAASPMQPSTGQASGRLALVSWPCCAPLQCAEPHRCLGAGGLGARRQAGLGAAEVRQARPALLPLLQGKGAGTSAPKGTDCSHNGMCTFQKAQPKQAACARRAKRGRGQAHHRLEDALARLDGQPADQAGSSDLRPLPLHLCVAGGASLQGRGVRRSMVRQRGGGRRRQGGGRAPCRPRRAAGVAQQQHTSGAPLLDAAAQASGACGRLQAAPERVAP